MSLLEYHKTTTNELLAITNKVRNLISHWGEDGRYKEAILKNIIKRFLPEKFKIGTGFVVKQTNTRGEHLSSQQIDLLIYDNDSPVLFKEGDFVILTPDAVRAIIEVKANLKNQGLAKVIKQANKNGEFIFYGKNNKEQPFFNGVFSYEGYNKIANIDTIVHRYLEGEISFSHDTNFKKYQVNHVALNKDWFIKIWEEDESPHSLYNLKDLSFSFFISNLTDILSNKSVKRNNFIWYATDKELNLERQY